MKLLGYEDYEIFYNKFIEEIVWFWGEVEKVVGY